MKTIKLTRGFSTIVDDDVFEWAKNYHWWCGQSRKDSSIKALTETAVNGKRVKFSLSRLIMKAPKGMQVDHINHDTLDNRKENLRICTAEENQQNKGFSRNNKCGYKGVHVVVYKTHATYISQIKDHKKVIHLGSFSNAVDAARAYDKAAIKCNGEFACTNEDLGLLNPEKECLQCLHPDNKGIHTCGIDNIYQPTHSSFAKITLYTKEQLDKAVSEAVEEFAKKVEEEVIGGDEKIPTYLGLQKMNNEDLASKLSINELKEEQRQSLKTLLKVKKTDDK